MNNEGALDASAEAPVRGPLSADRLASWRPGEAPPLFGELHGVDVVLTTLTDYRELMAIRARHTRATITEAVRMRKLPPAGLSTIEKDPAVADFLRERFSGRQTIAALHAACLAEFGPSRAPSRGRIHTFRSRWSEYR